MESRVRTGDDENRTTLKTYRQKASSPATELASARGRLSAIEEALTAARVRNAALEQKFAATQAERQKTELRLYRYPDDKTSFR